MVGDTPPTWRFTWRRGFDPFKIEQKLVPDWKETRRSVERNQYFILKEIQSWP